MLDELHTSTAPNGLSDRTVSPRPSAGAGHCCNSRIVGLPGDHDAR
jgi:hypothetical protein